MIWFGWVLGHINHFRLFNAKSMFIHVNSSILTIQFGVRIDFVDSELNVKTVIFIAIQFSMSTQFKSQNTSISNTSV